MVVRINCIVVHGCPSNIEKAMDPKRRTYDKHWIPWIRTQLSRMKINVEVPLMPEPWYPDYEKFKEEFDKYNADQNTVLVGHSCGCSFLVRWLGETKKRVKKLILVAPWKIAHEPYVFTTTFYDYEIDSTIKDRVGSVVIFTSNDEEADGKKSAKIFHRALGGKLIELKDKGHYILEDMGTEEFPELLKEIIS